MEQVASRRICSEKCRKVSGVARAPQQPLLFAFLFRPRADKGYHIVIEIFVKKIQPSVQPTVQKVKLSPQTAHVFLP